MIKCPLCHFENEDGALFCEQCKSDLSAVEAPRPADPISAALAPEPVSAEAVQAIPLAGTSEPFTAAAAAGDVLVAEAVPLPALGGNGAAPIEAAPPACVPMADVAPIPVDPEHALDAALVASEATAKPSDTLPTDTVAPAEPVAVGERPKLVVIRGQRINVEYPLYEGDNYIGRTDDKPVDVDLEDQEAPDRVWSSRQHAVITIEGGKMTVEDLNSTNGTFVNRTRVHPGEKRPLQVNDVIQVGTVQMRVKA